MKAVGSSFLVSPNLIRSRITHLLVLGLIILLGLVSLPDALARDTVRIYASVAAGGSVDTMARITAEKLGQLLDLAVVVENKPGGGGNLATQTAARGAPDGSVLLVSANNHTLNLTLYKDPGYQLDDLIPVGELMRGPSVVVVPANSPYQNLGELIEDARQHPNKLSFGTAGIGTPSHIAAELFVVAAGIKAQSVPYRGSAPSLADLAGGQLPYAVSSLVAAMPLIKAKKIRPLGVTSKKRWPGALDIPAISEYGMPDFEYLSWIGLFAPRDTPAAIIEKYSNAVRQAMQDPDVMQKVAAMGAETGNLDAKTFATFIDNDYKLSKDIVKSSGMKAE
jgi:tripartite-type tricarboxylate transporter receptor subunit TctC